MLLLFWSATARSRSRSPSKLRVLANLTQALSAQGLSANDRYRILLTAGPLRLPRAVGSRVTPIATVGGDLCFSVFLLPYGSKDG